MKNIVTLFQPLDPKDKTQDLHKLEIKKSQTIFTVLEIIDSFKGYSVNAWENFDMCTFGSLKAIILTSTPWQ